MPDYLHGARVDLVDLAHCARRGCDLGNCNPEMAGVGIPNVLLDASDGLPSMIRIRPGAAIVDQLAEHAVRPGRATGGEEG